MFGICKVLCVILSLGSGGISDDRQQAKLQETIFPEEVVNLVEAHATVRGIKPTSLLLLDLGDILTQGSFQTWASLLSLRPSVHSGVEVHNELWQALAAPLKVIAVVSQEESLRNFHFFISDFVQNIRHKFVYLVFTRTEAQRITYGEGLFAFSMRTIILTGRSRRTYYCFENRDNVFLHRAVKRMKDCDLSAAPCELESFRERFEYAKNYDAFQPRHTLQFRCNKTRVEINYRLSWKTEPTYLFQQVSTTRWNLLVGDYTDCYSYTPFSSTDVTALLKPFSLGVWCAVFATVIILAMAWSAIVRRSALVFSGNTVLSIVGAREVELAPRNFSSTVLGCTTVAFTCLIGQLYSNCVMSTFLNPTARMPHDINIFNCVNIALCQKERSLNLLLESMPACHILPRMLALAKKPLSRFKASNPFGRRNPHFLKLISNPYYDGKLRSLPLVRTQTSMIWDRILQHGILSSMRLAVAEGKAFSESRTHINTLEYKLSEDHWFGVLEKVVANKSKLNFISFDTTREWFDMTSFLKITPLFGCCFGFILVWIGVELCCAKRASLQSSSEVFIAGFQLAARQKLQKIFRGLLRREASPRKTGFKSR